MCDLDIGKAIKMLRAKNKMSQMDLYKATGIVPGYISKLENYKIKYPKLKTIYKLAQAFQIKPSEFIYFAEKENSDSCRCNDQVK